MTQHERRALHPRAALEVVVPRDRRRRGWHSAMGLDTVELVMDVEDHFGVSLPREDGARVRSIRDSSALVVKELAKHGGPQIEQRVLDDICRITAEHTGCEIEEVQPETRFVDDLGMD